MSEASEAGWPRERALVIPRLFLGLCAVVLLACGGKRGGETAPPGSAAVRAYPATRWIPAKASYAIAARTVRDAQQGVRDLIDTFGVLGDVTVTELSAELSQLLLVDPLSPDAVTHIGIDLEGGFAMFSDAYNPTVVVRLASEPAFRAFIDRRTNLELQSVVVDGTEVFTAPLPDGLRISWAVADAWLWVHVALPDIPDDGATWFSASRKPGAPTWGADFEAAKGGAEPPVVGFVDAARLVADVQARVPEVAQCFGALQVSGIGKLGVALAGDTKQANARLALDVGPLAPAIAAAVLPIPEGFGAATAQVPIAAQWNIDLAAARAKLDPCVRLFGADLRAIDELGIRAARGYLRTFDPDDRDGTGAVSLDLTHKDFFAAKLDDIPLRSTLERKRTFGPYAGKSISIPMFLTVDYVLTDQVALAGIGDGQLLTMIGKGGATKGPLFEVAVQPLGLSVESWTALFELLDIDHAKRVAERLQRWREARVNLTIDGSRLVLAASGTRR